MRILHVSSLWPPKQIGGAEKSASLLAEAQAAAGHDVFAACGWPTDEDWAERAGVKVRRIGHRSLFWQEDAALQGRLVWAAAKALEGVNRAYARSFGAAIDECRPHIVHTHSLVALTPLIWREAKKRGARVVHTIRDFDLVCARSTRVRNGRYCETRCLQCRVLTRPKVGRDRQVDAVVGISHDVLDRHLAEGWFRHLPDGRRRVIWNPVAVPSSRRDPPREGPIVFGFLGRISPEKGVDDLLAAAASLPPHGWCLRIAGGPSDARQDTHHEALRERAIDWVGWVDPDAFLRTIDVLVVPSVWPEPFGRVTVEAFARDVPVLGAASGGTLDLVGAHNRDWLFPPGDPTALARSMSRLVAAGRPIAAPLPWMRSVVDRCGVDDVFRHYEEIYRTVLSEETPS